MHVVDVDLLQPIRVRRFPAGEDEGAFHFAANVLKRGGVVVLLASNPDGGMAIRYWERPERPERPERTEAEKKPS